LIELARSKPNVLSHGSNGIGTSAHLAGELLKSMAGIKMVHVPYKGGAPLYTDMMGGRVQVAIAILGSAMPLVKTGKLKLLAVTSPDRSALFKEYPPISATLPGYDMTTWNGFVVPAGTPTDKMVEIGYEVSTLTAAEFDANIRSEIESKRKVVRESGAKFE
jgi:tripartite-type tricarboxylate transporter receptor subunit TctC